MFQALWVHLRTRGCCIRKEIKARSRDKNNILVLSHIQAFLELMATEKLFSLTPCLQPALHSSRVLSLSCANTLILLLQKGKHLHVPVEESISISNENAHAISFLAWREAAHRREKALKTGEELAFADRGFG